MSTLRSPILASLFTALIVVGAYLKIPIGPVPIVLANLFVLLAGAVLGIRWALASVGLYLFLGALGLPVFAGGGGLSYFLGPTGGYLIAYLPAAAMVGAFTGQKKPKFLWDLLAFAAGALIIYMVGVPWLKIALDTTWKETLALGMIPFLIGDSVKVAGALAILTLLRRYYPELLFREKLRQIDEPSLG